MAYVDFDVSIPKSSPEEVAGPLRCSSCRGVIGAADSCEFDVILYGTGEALPPVPYGAERFSESAGRDRCDDCGVVRGGAHHPGCAFEECPRCGGVVTGCECTLPLGPRHPFEDGGTAGRS